MAPIFFAFSFFAKNEEKRAIFREKRKKNKTKKNHTYENRSKLHSAIQMLQIFSSFDWKKFLHKNFLLLFITFYAGDNVEL